MHMSKQMQCTLHHKKKALIRGHIPKCFTALKKGVSR